MLVPRAKLSVRGLKKCATLGVMGSGKGKAKRVHSGAAVAGEAKAAVPTRLVPRTTNVAQVELDGEWYDHVFIESLIRTAAVPFFGDTPPEYIHFNSPRSSARSSGMWFEEKKTFVVESAQVESLLKRGWAKPNGHGGYDGTHMLLAAVKEAGGLPDSGVAEL